VFEAPGVAVFDPAPVEASLVLSSELVSLKSGRAPLQPLSAAQAKPQTKTEAPIRKPVNIEGLL
jgi:hypothetical protein